MDRWTEMALFVQVAETGSLSRAADELGLSNAAASRHLSALEERLGARLVERNTRRLYLTEPGQEFLRRSKAILAASVCGGACANRDKGNNPARNSSSEERIMKKVL